MSLPFLPQSSSLTFPGCSFHISCAHGWDQDYSARPWEGGFALRTSSSPWVLSPGMLNASAFIKFDWSQMKSQKLVRGEWQVRSLFSLVIFQSGKKRLSLSRKLIHQPDGQIRQHFVLKCVDSFHIPGFTADLWNTKRLKNWLIYKKSSQKYLLDHFPLSLATS